jgi:hypothetical protein
MEQQRLKHLAVAFHFLLPYSVLLCCSFLPQRALFSFLTWGVFVSQTAALTTWISPITLLPSSGPRKSVPFYLALKTGEVQVGVQGTALTEYFRIFWGIVWYCIIGIIVIIIIIIIIIIINFALSCCCSLNHYCLGLFVLILFLGGGV